jgi:hypothetical protein
VRHGNYGHQNLIERASRECKGARRPFLCPSFRRRPESISFKIKMDLLATSMWLALRAIGCADVRFGILPSQSGFRRFAPAPE